MTLGRNAYLTRKAVCCPTRRRKFFSDADFHNLDVSAPSRAFFADRFNVRPCPTFRRRAGPLLRARVLLRDFVDRAMATFEASAGYSGRAFPVVGCESLSYLDRTLRRDTTSSSYAPNAFVSAGTLNTAV